MNLHNDRLVRYDVSGNVNTPGPSNHAVAPNKVFYLNDTQVEHVQIQNMDQFLSTNYFQNAGYFLQPDRPGCSRELYLPTSYQLFYANQLNDPKNQTHIPASYANQVKEGLQYLNILQGKETDLPEFVDVNKLMPVDYQSLQMMGVNPVQEEEINFNQLSAKRFNETVVLDDDDDEVVFVQEYKIPEGDDYPIDESNKVEESAKESEEGSRRRRTKKVVEPRRNPKRQVQLQKASYDLAIKLSLSECPKKNLNKEVAVTPTSTKRTCRRTGAVFSPPRPLNSLDYKEWPTEGMHERPKFNSKTQKLEKFDYDYVPTAKVKRAVVRNKRSTRRRFGGKRRTNNKSEEDDAAKFAQQTHETLLLVIEYIKSVKKTNMIIREQHNTMVSEEANTKTTESLNVDEEIMNSIANIENDEDIIKDVKILLQDCVTKVVSDEDAHDKSEDVTLDLGSNISRKTEETTEVVVIDEAACQTVVNTSEKIEFTEEELENSVANTKDILCNSAVLYCLANNVTQLDLATFLESLVEDGTL